MAKLDNVAAFEKYHQRCTMLIQQLRAQLLGKPKVWSREQQEHLIWLCDAVTALGAGVSEIIASNR